MKTRTLPWRRSSHEIYKPLVQYAVHSSEDFCTVFSVPLYLLNSWFLVRFRGFHMPYLILTIWSIKYMTHSCFLKQQKPNVSWCLHCHGGNEGKYIQWYCQIENSSSLHFWIKYHSKYLFFPVTWGTQLNASNTNIISFCWQLKTLTSLS